MANTKNTRRSKSSKALPDDYIDDWDKSPSLGGKKIPAKKQQKMRWKRFLITVVLLIALLGLVHYCLVASVYAKMNYKAIENKSITDAPLKEDGVINILLIGNDSRQNGEDGRSDAMILLSVSTKTQKIYMTSLLRDMYVEIPGHDGNRLNAAYAYGGAELLMQTIEQNLDISVNRYMLVNFEAFANLVDAVKGIELELSSEEVAYVNGYLEEYNILTKRPAGTDYMDTSLSGMLHLNGPQALAYTRNRYLGTDFGRTERQRKVLSAVIKKLPKAAVTNSKELMDGLLPNLTTNLTQNECYLLSFYAPKLLTYELVQNSIPMDGTYKNANIRGMAVLEVDFDANKKFIRENVYGN
ncbi:MAG: LCP family protein [Lachnoclostridium sp.]|nr:LCP family protein [Lachnospira sp.]MCM1248002.1 LCP family protein [Lachnoclostridium sp.]